MTICIFQTLPNISAGISTDHLNSMPVSERNISRRAMINCKAVRPHKKKTLKSDKKMINSSQQIIKLFCSITQKNYVSLLLPIDMNESRRI